MTRPRTVEQQIAEIRATAARGVYSWLRASFVGLGLVLVVIGIDRAIVPCIVVGLFLLVMAWLVHDAAGHARAAAEASLHGERIAGHVAISLDDTGDTTRYHATVECLRGRWRFEFIPVHWTPRAGEQVGTLYCLPELPWPALVEVGEGIFFPRYAPDSAAVA